MKNMTELYSERVFWYGITIDKNIPTLGVRHQGGEEREDGGRRGRAVYFFEYQQCSTPSSFLSY